MTQRFSLLQQLNVAALDKDLRSARVKKCETVKCGLASKIICNAIQNAITALLYLISNEM